jgi:tyrosyl-tRNA synthetase
MTTSSETNYEEILTRGVAEVIDKDRLLKRLESGEKLRLKLGLDPNKPEIHIGHAVPLRKLREFQNLGHQIVIILGDYTAQLGDPSDKSEARKLVSAEETKRNADAYLKQIFLLLDKDKTEVHRNSEWFNTFNLRDVIELMANTTVNQLLSHETFQKRLDGNLPLHAQEIIYPLMQGYDSVAIKADVEFGASDQKFNLLMGRVLQRAHGQKEQDIMLMPYLHGTDGDAKMSKSLGNTINLTDSATDMFGKTMSIPDEFIVEYFELATLVPAGAIELIAKDLAKGTTNPRDIKLQLARELTGLYHGPKAAADAEEAFIALFQKGLLPEDIQEKKMSASYKTAILAVADSGLVSSNNEARRLIEQGGVKIDGRVITDPLAPTKLKKGIIIQVGKRRFVKVK